jgi:hypothetical protein
VTALINTGVVQTVDMGRSDEQLYDQNSKIFADNLSCLRTASRRGGTVVRTVAHPLQVISLLRLHAPGPWGIAVRTVDLLHTISISVERASGPW